MKGRYNLGAASYRKKNTRPASLSGITSYSLAPATTNLAPRKCTKPQHTPRVTLVQNCFIIHENHTLGAVKRFRTSTSLTT